MVALMGRVQDTNLPYSYGCLCCAPTLHPAWGGFLPDPTTSRVIMLRLVVLVYSRVREGLAHEMVRCMNIRVSRAPCVSEYGSDSSPELATLHGQCVTVDLVPLATYLCCTRQTADVFKALLQGCDYSIIRSDVLDDMLGVSLRTMDKEVFQGRNSTTVGFCPDLIAKAKHFQAPIQRMQFLRRASAAIRGMGTPPAALMEMPS